MGARGGRQAIVADDPRDSVVVPLLAEEAVTDRREEAGPPGGRARAAAAGTTGRGSVPGVALSRWTGGASLDVFLSRLYAYFCGKGYWAFVTGHVLGLLSLAFTLALSALLLLFIDWPALLRGCPEKPAAPPRPAPPAPPSDLGSSSSPSVVVGADALFEQLGWVYSSLLRSPTGPNAGPWLDGPKAPPAGNGCDLAALALLSRPRLHSSAAGRAYDILSLGYLALGTGFLLWELWRAVFELRSLIAVARFCNLELSLSDRELRTLPWCDIVVLLGNYERADAKGSNAGAALTAHDVAGRILRRDNYLVALLNMGILQPRLPLGRPSLPASLEWNLQMFVLRPLFASDGRMRPEAVDAGAARRLRARLRLVAAGNLALSPFVALFLCFRFYLSETVRLQQELNAMSAAAFGARAWTPHARWLLRDFNELPHLFDRRLAAAASAASAYRGLFADPTIPRIARFVAYVCGALTAVLITLTLCNERLLEGTLRGRALLYYGAILSAALTVARALAVAPQPTTDPASALAEVAAHSQHLPRHWRGRAACVEVQHEMDALFSHRSFLFVEEMLGAFATPFFLWNHLAPAAPALIEFFRHFRADSPGAGTVCSLAAFDVAAHGSASYGAPLPGAPPGRRARQGKLEKSLVAFAAANPSWEPSPPSAAALLQELADFAAEAEAAIALSPRPGIGSAAKAARRAVAAGNSPRPTLGIASLRPVASQRVAGALVRGLLSFAGAGASGGGGGGDTEGTESGLYREYGPQAVDAQANLQRLYEARRLVPTVTEAATSAAVAEHPAR